MSEERGRAVLIVIIRSRLKLNIEARYLLDISASRLRICDKTHGQGFDISWLLRTLVIDDHTLVELYGGGNGGK